MRLELETVHLYGTAGIVVSSFLCFIHKTETPVAVRLCA